nr:hypothetical protein [Streptomyces sp. HNM0575]
MITVISARHTGTEGTEDSDGTDDAEGAHGTEDAEGTEVPAERALDFRLYPQRQRRHAVGGRQEIKTIVHAHSVEPRGAAGTTADGDRGGSDEGGERGSGEDGGGDGGSDDGRLPPGSLGLLIAVDFAPERLEATREALTAAIDALPDGVRFALLEERTGADGSPREPEWETADLWQRRRAQATAQWMHLNARLMGLGGREGPACADWLAQARTMFAQDAPGVRLRHLLIVTDGRSARTPELEAELDACEGLFTCGMLGVGDGWRPEVLAGITERLHGDVEYVRNGAEAAALLTKTVDRLLRTRMPVATLEVALRAGVELTHIRQVSPRPRPLTEAAVRPERPAEQQQSGPVRRAFTTRMWRAGEPRTYELTLEAGPSGDPLKEDLQLAAVTLGSAHAPLLVRWSAVRGSAAGVVTQPWAGGPVSAIGQRTKLVYEFTEGCKALGRGDVLAAEAHLGAATRLAHELGDSEFMNDVRSLADVFDAAKGKLKVRPGVDRLSLNQAELRGHTSALLKRQDAGDPDPATEAGAAAGPDPDRDRDRDPDGPSSSDVAGRTDRERSEGTGRPGTTRHDRTPSGMTGTSVVTCECGSKSRTPQSSYCIRCGAAL